MCSDASLQSSPQLYQDSPDPAGTLDGLAQLCAQHPGCWAFVPPEQAALPASALVPGQSRGTEGLCKWPSLPGLNLLLPSFTRKMAGHGQTHVQHWLCRCPRLVAGAGTGSGQGRQQHSNLSSSSPPFPPSSLFLLAAAIPSSPSVSRPNLAPESMTDCGERGYFCVSI